MMDRLLHQIELLFLQLQNTIEQLTNQQYSEPANLIFNATIGQHIRHIIELYQILEIGYTEGVVNYETRKRDHQIETQKELAIQSLQSIFATINKPNKKLLLETEYALSTNEPTTIETNYYRELVYNLEHTVHHMALIRVAINEVSNIQLPKEFGIASATIKFRASCAQ